MDEEVLKFETKNNLVISSFLESKVGYDYIIGFYNAFLEYKKEMGRLKSEYSDFFAGKINTPINIEYVQFMSHGLWFSEVLSSLQKEQKDSLSEGEKKNVGDFIFDTFQEIATNQDFHQQHRKDFQFYVDFFNRLYTEKGFLDPQRNLDEPIGYINFLEFKETASKMTRQEDENFIKQMKADLLSGKIKN